ncbi:MAG: exodeoxyribonuclease VII small subunit [Bacteroidota bacterium]
MTKKKKTTISSYKTAYEELQQIVDQIEEGSIGIDDLAARSQRAAELIQFCRDKLRTTEKELGQLFKE